MLQPNTFTLPYGDLSLRISHSTFSVKTIEVDEVESGSFTKQSLTAVSSSVISICESPQFPHWGLTLVRHTPCQCSHHRSPRPACHRGILPFSYSRHKGHSKEFPSGKASHHYSVYPNVRTLWKIRCQPSLHKPNVQMHNKCSAS